MTQPNTALARQEAPPKKDLSLRDVCEMTGYELPQVAMIRHNMALSMAVKPDDVPLYDIALFCHATKTLGLDPLVRQAYWIRRAGKGALQIGIDGFRAIADRAGNYAGSSEPVFRRSIEWEHRGRKLIVPEYCQVTVWKIVQGHKCAFTGEARWMEYVPQPTAADGLSDMWAKMPHNQLAKCAEAQGIRKGWALQVGQAAFRPDDGAVDGELPEVAAPVRIVEQPQPQQRPKATTDDYDRVFANQFGDEQPQPQQRPKATTDDADKHQEQPTPEAESPLALALSRNKNLLDEAHKYQVPGLGKYKAEHDWPLERIEAANTALGERIREKNGDAETAKKQDATLG